MGSLWRMAHGPNGAVWRLRGYPHSEASAAEFCAVRRIVGAGPAEDEQPADDGESGDGEVAERERPPHARLLPALALPRRRLPRTTVPGRPLPGHQWKWID